MPQTRASAKRHEDESGVENKENHPPHTSSKHQPTNSESKTIGKKRKSTPEQNAATGRKKRNSDNKSASKPKKVKKGEANNDEEVDQMDQSQKPRLSTPDLEFDYDRSQLRDPRPTPGRKARPRYYAFDIPQELRAHLEATREIPKPKKPTGRLNAMQKDELLKQEALMNPLETFHDLHRCLEKGRDGSPTYDDAGFQLDWGKVNRWSNPQAYNKKKMIRGMDKTIKKDKHEEKDMFTIFFGKKQELSDDTAQKMRHFIKDHVSKDLDIPWHQIGPEKVQMWRDKGFGPVSFEDWWKGSSPEDEKRNRIMSRGASLRKDL